MGTTNSRMDIATWTQQAYANLWLADPAVAGVMPFELQDPNWDAFNWIDLSNAPYPVYTTVRAFRCTRIAGRCP
jgi:hypothetical protein